MKKHDFEDPQATLDKIAVLESRIYVLEALTATQNEYIALLGADMDRFMYLRVSRGLNSPPEVAAKGQELRDRIAALAAHRPE